MIRFAFTAMETGPHYPWAPPGWACVAHKIYQQLGFGTHSGDATAAGVCIVASWLRHMLRKPEAVDKGVNYAELTMLAALPLYDNSKFAKACKQPAIAQAGEFEDFHVSLADNRLLSCSDPAYGWHPVLTSGSPQNDPGTYAMMSVISVPRLLVQLVRNARDTGKTFYH